MKGPGVRALVGAMVAGTVLLLSSGALGSGATPAVALAALPAQAETTVVSDAAQPTVVTEARPSTSATKIGDPSADRRIRRILVGLVGLAGIVFVATIALLRATRPVPVPLRRLSVMETRTWRRADDATRKALLGRTDLAAADDGADVVVAPAAMPSVAQAELSPDGVATSNGAAAPAVPAAEEPSGPGASVLADG